MSFRKPKWRTIYREHKHNCIEWDFTRAFSNWIERISFWLFSYQFLPGENSWSCSSKRVINRSISAICSCPIRWFGDNLNCDDFEFWQSVFRTQLNYEECSEGGAFIELNLCLSKLTSHTQVMKKKILLSIVVPVPCSWISFKL